VEAKSQKLKLHFNSFCAIAQDSYGDEPIKVSLVIWVKWCTLHSKVKNTRIHELQLKGGKKCCVQLLWATYICTMQNRRIRSSIFAKNCNRTRCKQIIIEAGTLAEWNKNQHYNKNHKALSLPHGKPTWLVHEWHTTEATKPYLLFIQLKYKLFDFQLILATEISNLTPDNFKCNTNSKYEIAMENNWEFH
jgi:hypothetical protein